MTPAATLPRFTRRDALLALIPALVAALAYLSTLDAELVWDDALIAFRQLPYYHSWTDAFASSRTVPFATVQYYRPLTLLSFQLDRLLAPERLALAFHASNLVFHIAATLLLFALARRLYAGRGEGEWGALAAALLFALHPVHVESVAMAAGRTDLLATVFTLAALLAGIAYRRRGGPVRLAAWAGFLLLGLLAKEVALAALALLPALLWALPSGTREEGAGRRAGGLAAAALAALGVYGILRLGAGGGVTLTLGALGKALADLPGALGYYLAKLAVPWPLDPLPEPLSAVAGVGVLAAAGAAGWALRRAFPADRALAAALGLWFAAALAPSLVVLTQRDVPSLVTERYLYLPSAAFCLLLGLAAARAPLRLRGVVGAGLVVLLGLYAAGTLWQARVWRANIPFWEYTVSRGNNARDSVACFNLAESYRLAGRYVDAASVLERMLADDIAATIDLRAQVSLKLGAVNVSLGWEALRAGRHQEALARVNQGLALLGPLAQLMAGDYFYYVTEGVGRLVKAQAVEALTGKPDLLLLTASEGYLRKARDMDPEQPLNRTNLEEVEKALERARRKRF